MSPVILIAIAFISGASKAVSDTLQFWWKSSVFARHPKVFNPQWWEPRLSHKNKNKPKNYFVRVLTRTIFVTLTDAWHTFQFISYFPLFIAIALVHYYGVDMFGFSTYNDWLDVLILATALYACRMGGFTFTKSIVKR